MTITQTAAVAAFALTVQATGMDTIRIRGQVLIEGGAPLANAQIKTDAIRGPQGAQFVAQKYFTVRTGRNGEWSLLGITRGLWILEVTAFDHLPHVVVVPIAWMLRPEPAAWDTSLALLPESRVAPASGSAAARQVVEAATAAQAGQKSIALEMLRRLVEADLEPDALCAAGDIALLVREPALGREFFDKAADRRANLYRAHLGVASASMMMLDFDRAMKAYAAARSATANKRLERMLSGAIRDLQQIRTIGGRG
jgi:hypothetical protein